MSPEEAERDILERRAAELAQVVESEWQQETVSRVTVVTVGEEAIGIPAEVTNEIVRAPEVARLPNLPAWILGVFQHRGELVTAVDLAAWVHRSTSPGKRRDGFMVLVQDGRDLSLGLFVDSIVGFREVRAHELAAQFDDESTTKSRPITAVTRDLTALLDIERLFNDPELGRSADKEEKDD